MLTPDPLPSIRHWEPSPQLGAWQTQKRRSGGEQLVTLRQLDRPGNRGLDLPHR